MLPIVAAPQDHLEHEDKEDHVVHVDDGVVDYQGAVLGQVGRQILGQHREGNFCCIRQASMA